MNIYGLALDREYTSYEELRPRQVVAQGWRQLGDLRTLCRLAADPRYEARFRDAVTGLAELAYGRRAPHLDRPGNVMWNLMRAQAGDLFVAIEGTVVRGISQVLAPGAFTYQFEPNFEYAQTFGHPVRWFDWDLNVFGPAPTAPAQSVPGVAQVRNERNRIARAWEDAQAGLD